MVKTFNLGLTGSIYESKEMDNEFYRETVSEFMENRSDSCLAIDMTP